MKCEGIIKIRRLPDDWSEEDYKRWWLPEVIDGYVVHKARMSAREKDKYNDAEEIHNLITTAGKTAILNFIASSASYGNGFANFLSIGTAAIAGVAVGDTTVVNDSFYRLSQSIANGTLTGNQMDCAFGMSGASGNGTWSNMGLYGNSATVTYGTGTLYTHALSTYTKVTGSVTVNYIFVIS